MSPQRDFRPKGVVGASPIVAGVGVVGLPSISRRGP